MVVLLIISKTSRGCNGDGIRSIILNIPYLISLLMVQPGPLFTADTKRDSSIWLKEAAGAAESRSLFLTQSLMCSCWWPNNGGKTGPNFYPKVFFH